MDKPVMDIMKIRDLLPHRYPFLLVDKVIKLENKYIECHPKSDIENLK